MRESLYRAPQRDTTASSLARALEVFFGGNADVEAVVLFDSLGETIDYHSYVDPFQVRLVAAHCGILFELARFKMSWLQCGGLETMEISADAMNFVASRVCEEYVLLVMARKDTGDGDLLDAVTGCIEVLRKEIGC